MFNDGRPAQSALVRFSNSSTARLTESAGENGDDGTHMFKHAESAIGGPARKV